jgi:hypothetical protein
MRAILWPSVFWNLNSAAIYAAFIEFYCSNIYWGRSREPGLAYTSRTFVGKSDLLTQQATLTSLSMVTNDGAAWKTATALSEFRPGAEDDVEPWSMRQETSGPGQQIIWQAACQVSPRTWSDWAVPFLLNGMMACRGGGAIVIGAESTLPYESGFSYLGQL